MLMFSPVHIVKISSPKELEVLTFKGMKFELNELCPVEIGVSLL